MAMAASAGDIRCQGCEGVLRLQGRKQRKYETDCQVEARRIRGHLPLHDFKCKSTLRELRRATKLSKTVRQPQYYRRRS